MKKYSPKSKTKAIALFSSLLFFSANTCFAQQNAEPATSENPFVQLTVQCKVNVDHAMLHKVRVNVYQENQLIESFKVRPDRKFNLGLDLNHHYTFEFEGKGLVSNRVAVNADVPADVLHIPLYRFNVNMMSNGNVNEKLTNSDAFEFPVALIAFDEEYYDFTHAPRYTRSIKSTRRVAMLGMLND